MLTCSRLWIDPRCLIVFARLVDVLVGNGLDLGAVPIAIVREGGGATAELG